MNINARPPFEDSFWVEEEKGSRNNITVEPPTVSLDKYSSTGIENSRGQNSIALLRHLLPYSHIATKSLSFNTLTLRWPKEPDTKNTAQIPSQRTHIHWIWSARTL